MSTNALLPRVWFVVNCHDCSKWFRFESSAARDAFARNHGHSHVVVDDIDADRHPHYGQLPITRGTNA